MTKSIIVAHDRNRGIGANNDLLWGRDLPDDLANFKRVTTGKSVIMGRKTFESMGSRPLPGRQNIVIASAPTGVEGVITCASLSSAYTMAQFDIFVIGGARLYVEALDTVDRLYITEVDAEFSEADVFFPDVDMGDWREVSRSHHAPDERNRYGFDLAIYERII